MHYHLIMPMVVQPAGVHRHPVGDASPPDEYRITLGGDEIGRTKRVTSGNRRRWRPLPQYAADIPGPEPNHTEAVRVLISYWEQTHEREPGIPVLVPGDGDPFAGLLAD
jgi:hypothetical protein